MNMIGQMIGLVSQLYEYYYRSTLDLALGLGYGSCLASAQSPESHMSSLVRRIVS